jgi:hypothetical protein
MRAFVDAYKREKATWALPKEEGQGTAMTEETFTLIVARSKSPLKFFLLVFALSLPFWLAGTLTSLQLLPALPISALMFLCPVTRIVF